MAQFPPHPPSPHIHLVSDYWLPPPKCHSNQPGSPWLAAGFLELALTGLSASGLVPVPSYVTINTQYGLWIKSKLLAWNTHMAFTAGPSHNPWHFCALYTLAGPKHERCHNVPGPVPPLSLCILPPLMQPLRSPCGSQCKTEIRGPCVKCIVNFKMATAKQQTKFEAIPG